MRQALQSVRDCYYKVPQVLQSVTDFIAKGYMYYKMWQLLQSETEYNKEWCKVQKGIDLLFQNWYEEFGKFWHEYSKISKVCTLTGSFWPKYKMFELMALKIDSKFEEKVTCAFKNDMSNLTNFHKLKNSGFILEIKMAGKLYKINKCNK